MTARIKTPVRLSSQLFPLLFDKLEARDDRPVRVLDLGQVNSHTVKFFNQFRCKLYCTDIFQDLEKIKPQVSDEEAVLTEQDLVAHFSELLDLPDDSCFDIVLFWDHLNDLDNSSVKAFALALRPYMHDKTRAHAFAVLNRSSSLTIKKYGIVGIDELIVNANDENRNLQFPHPQASLNNLLNGMEVKRSILRSDGRLEVILHSSP